MWQRHCSVHISWGAQIAGSLWMCIWQVTGEGLAVLQGLTDLQYLDVSGTSVAGGLSHMPSLRHLRFLSLAQCSLTDSSEPSQQALAKQHESDCHDTIMTQT